MENALKFLAEVTKTMERKNFDTLREFINLRGRAGLFGRFLEDFCLILFKPFVKCFIFVL
jgi:hypothetical protein